MRSDRGTAGRTAFSAPRPGVRMRMAMVYGALFLVFGAALLAVAYAIASNPPKAVVTRHVLPARHGGLSLLRLTAPTPAGLRSAQRAADLHALLIGSAIALGVTAVVSIALGWLVSGRILRPWEAAFEAQRRFAAHASHELRTPLAMMRTSLDVTMAKPPPAPSRLVELDGKLREGLDAADALVEEFLTLTRAQRGELGERRVVSLAQLVGDALGARAEEIAGRGIEVQRVLADVEVDGNPTLLARLVDNVCENAILHNGTPGWMRVACRPAGSAARFEVSSGGPPLSAAEVAELVEPFHRGADARRSAPSGSGLGLSIVAAIAEAHGGTLALSPRDGGGLDVRIELPRVKRTEP